MKFFKYDTTSELARPGLKSWLVIFVCGFLTACIIALVLFIVVWLVALAYMMWKGAAVSPFENVTMTAAMIIILKAASVVGALVATVLMLELLRRSRQEGHVCGSHAVIGEFKHRPFYKTWHAEPVLPTGNPVRLSGYGSHPSDAQAALWQQFISQFKALMDSAEKSLLTEPHPLQGCERVTLTPCGITLALDGGLHVGFEYTTEPENYGVSEAEPLPYPTASFTPALVLKGTEWLNDYS